MWIPVREVGVQADDLEQVADLILALLAATHTKDVERFRDNSGDSHPWIERGRRILKDHLNVAAERPHLRPAEAADIGAVEADLPDVGS